MADLRKNITMRTWSITLLLIIVSALSVLLLHSIGIASRNFGASSSIAEKRYQVYVADDSRELYSIWKDRGMKGRIVLNVGNFFHFLSIKREDIYRQKSEYPVKRLNLSKEYEKRVNNKNVLRVAMKTGIARMIYHLVSPEVYKEQTRLIEDGIRDGTIKDIWLSADKISTHERGSERVVTVSMPDLSESVLLVLDASYFSYADEGILNRLLNESKIETDLLIFNLERDNADVTMLERQRLKAFADGFAK